MQAFIKDKRSFATLMTLTVLDYELKPSIYDTVSTVMVKRADIKTGDFIIFDGLKFIGVIDAAETIGEKTILSVAQIQTIFSRKMFYQEQGYEFVEDYTKTLLDENFTACADKEYRMPFLQVEAVTHTRAATSPDLDNGQFSVMSYMSKIRRLRNIFCEASADKDNLFISIRRKILAEKNVDFSNYKYRIEEQSFSDYNVAKVSCLCTETGEVSDWYKLASGVITTRPGTAKRAVGEWITVTEAMPEEVEDTVRSTFSKSAYSHKITFQTEQPFELYDRLSVRLNGNLYKTYVSGMTIRNGSKVNIIECGELQTMFPYLDLI